LLGELQVKGGGPPGEWRCWLLGSGNKKVCKAIKEVTKLLAKVLFQVIQDTRGVHKVT